MTQDAGVEAARRFHETYERLAPQFGYETRAETKVFDPDSPNGKLMAATVSEVMAAHTTPNKYEAAWREMHDALSWMQGHKGLTRYLGWNFARVANDLIKRAYPDLAKDIPDA